MFLPKHAEYKEADLCCLNVSFFFVLCFWPELCSSSSLILKLILLLKRIIIMSAVIGVLGLLLTEALCSSKSMITYLTYSRVADYVIGLFLLDSLCVSNKVQQWSSSWVGDHGLAPPTYTLGKNVKFLYWCGIMW